MPKDYFLYFPPNKQCLAMQFLQESNRTHINTCTNEKTKLNY